MKFIGRSNELNTMNRMFRKDGFEMLILYGRRRVGKTTLLNRFAADKNALYYTGIESKDEENLREFGSEVLRHFDPSMPEGVGFRSYQDILTYISSAVQKAASANPSVSIFTTSPGLTFDLMPSHWLIWKTL